jgi:hypothetical protein
MGARESTRRNADDTQTSDAPTPDYYQLLEVDENATVDEIKVNQIFVSRELLLWLYEFCSVPSAD